MDLKQPFSLSDIKKYPKEVVIAMLVCIIIFAYHRNDLLRDDNIRLNARIDSINTVRVRMYDKLYFLQDKVEKQSTKINETDSLLRKETQPQVEKILKK